jgi:hypothetical protein
MASESPMPTTNDQEVIDAIRERGQINVAALIVGVVFMLGMSIVLDPFGIAQRRGGKGDKSRAERGISPGRKRDKSNYLRLGERAAR